MVFRFLSVLCWLSFILFRLNVCAQQTQVFKPSVNRVLFVLDVSGSMKETWHNKPKYDIAKELLYKLIDSVERKNPNVEFGVRAFGFQNHRSERNCKDSKLLVPFAKNNASAIQKALNSIQPQGMTPIAYSLMQAGGDFPPDNKALNSIIVITDGNENCDGDPCKASQYLLDKRISLRPFIVGLNAGEDFIKKLRCIGTVLDAQDEKSLEQTVGVIIRQTLNTTTAQVNLLDANANPTVTNIPFTLYDHTSGKILYNFIHTMNEKGNPDTLFLDPVGIYDLEVHTYPSIRKENIELTPGKHNIISVDVNVGSLRVECGAASIANNNAQAVIRTNKKKGILNVQDLNEEERYLSDDYTFELLTNPPIITDTTVTAFNETVLKVPHYGLLSLMSDDKLLVSIYQTKEKQLKMVERFELVNKTENRRLQPGNYKVVYKSKNSYRSESTRSRVFDIREGETTVLTLSE